MTSISASMAAISRAGRSLRGSSTSESRQLQIRWESTIASPACQSTRVGTTAGSQPPLTEVLPVWVVTSGRPKWRHPIMRRRTWEGK